MRIHSLRRAAACVAMSVAAVVIPSQTPRAELRADRDGNTGRSMDQVITLRTAMQVRVDETGYYSRVVPPAFPSQQGVPVPPVQFQKSGTDARKSVPGWHALPLYGGSVNHLAASPAYPRLVFASVLDGFATSCFFQSEDGGVSWSSVILPTAPPFTKGFVDDIEFARDGTALVTVTNALVRRDPQSGGWSVVRSGFYDLYNEVSINPGDAREIWLGGYEAGPGLPTEARIWRSIDAGATWDIVTPPIDDFLPCTGIAINSNDSRRVVVSFGFNQREVWRTLDAGSTWTKASGLPPGEIIDVVYDGVRFLGGGNRANAGVVVSNDDGLTWTRVSNSSWPSTIIMDLDVDLTTTGVVLVTTARGLERLANGTWSQGFGITGKELQTACVFHGDPDHMLIAQESEGILRTADGGAHFSVSSTGLLALNVRNVACNPLDPMEIAAAFQAMNSGGVYLSYDGGQSWQLQPLSSKRYSALEYAPDGVLYTAHNGPFEASSPTGVYRRNDNGTWAFIGPSNASSPFGVAKITCIRVDRANPSRIFASGSTLVGNAGAIWRSNDAGAHWDEVYRGNPDEEVNEVQFVDDGTGMRFFASVNYVGILSSDDGGEHWSPTLGVTGDAFDGRLRGTPADPNAFYETMYRSSAIVSTHNAGQRWDILRAPEGTLALEVDRSDPNTLYVSCDVPPAIFRSTDGAQSFDLFDDGCPPSLGNNFTWGDGPCTTLYFATTGGIYARELDTTAPQLSLELMPQMLWPPDHKMKTIHARLVTSDACDAVPKLVLSSIQELGEGARPDDIVARIGEETTTFQLRAERTGSSERRYLVTYASTDASGNTAEASATVLVPHDRSGLGLGENGDGREVPVRTELIAVEPNPFNPTTVAMFTLDHAQRVTLEVYDVRGARVRTLASSMMPAGFHRVPWDGVDGQGRAVASGVYFFRFAAGAHVQTQKALLIK